MTIVHKLEQRGDILVLQIFDDDDRVLTRVTLATHNTIITRQLVIIAHLEKFSEVRTAGREKHLVCRQLLALHPQRDVNKLLLGQQTVEGRDQLPLVIVPAEREYQLIRQTRDHGLAHHFKLYLCSEPMVGG